VSQFPAQIVSQRLGVLKLVESPINEWTLHRQYVPLGHVKFESDGVLLRETGVEITVAPPSAGITDAAVFGALVDDLVDEVVGGLPEILHAATEVVEEAIGEFWQIEDEAAPSVQELMRQSELWHIHLNPADRQHMLTLFDRGDLIGGHDLVIYLNAHLYPVSANFDG